jgi:hypothetical protein
MIRAALYWAPATHDPLWQAGNAWLGRDPELACDLQQPPIPGIEEATASPRRYGFHATLRPPMQLATGWEEFMADAAALARRTAPFLMPALAVMNMDGFLALGERAPSMALRELADACVEATDRHRRRPGEAELARRRQAGLSPYEEEMLQRWGYPYVMQAWRFHVTLSRRLSEDEMSGLKARAEAHFAAALSCSRQVDEIAVFTQKDDAAFLLAGRLRLEGRK